MKITIMKHSDELHICKPFLVDHLLWGTKSIPATYGRIGFVPQEGFYLLMTCEEKDPLCIYTEPNSPVYKDSAMEAFFCFCPDGTSSDIYLNFEMNSSGALLAMYGSSRRDRTPFSREWIARCRCRSWITETDWSVELFVPLEILREIYGELSFDAGTSLSLNFYKISEDPAIEHYASYAPIPVPSPDFHLPRYFEEAVLVRPSE